MSALRFNGSGDDAVERRCRAIFANCARVGKTAAEQLFQVNGLKPVFSLYRIQRFFQKETPLSFDLIKGKNNFLTRAVLLLLALTFVIGFGYVGGISIGGRSPTGGTAAEVNGEKISLAYFYNARDTMLQPYRESGQQLSDELLEFISFTALDNIINRKLLAQRAEDLGISVSSQELSDAIRNDPGFQVDGAFIGAQRYRDYITRSLEIPVSEFEKSYRDGILARKLITLLESSVVVTDQELSAVHRLNGEQISLDYISFSSENYIEDVSVSEDEAKKHYEEAQNMFRSIEKRKVRYAKLSLEDFTAESNVSSEQAEIYYNTYPDEFFAASGDIKPFEQVREGIEKQLAEQRAAVDYESFLESFLSRKKRSFSDLLSERPSLEVKETVEFGIEDEGEDVPEILRSRAFDTDQGNFSELVLSDSTWFFEVTEVVPGKHLPFEQARGMVESSIREKKAVQAARDAAADSLEKMKVSSESFSVAAKSLGLSIERTGLFTRGGTPAYFPDSPEFTIDVFGLDSDSPTSDEVYRSDSTFYLVSLAQTESADMEDFEQSIDELRRNEEDSRTQALISAVLEELRRNSKIVHNKALFPSGV